MMPNVGLGGRANASARTSSRLRIATWNCARGPLVKKRAAIDRLRPDVVVLTEAPRPTDGDGDVLWFGEGRHGVAIYTRGSYAVRELETSRAVPCVYPVAVDGPTPFTLFGVWTWPAPTYKGAFIAGLDAHQRITGARVLAGDFNGNVDFDKPRSRTKWSYCFDRLRADGLVSAYHRDRPFGGEAEPTHYFQWKEHQPFHLDYCFVPREWKIDRVTVGSYPEWATLSDHRPVIVDLRCRNSEVL
jgi:hypothetical protein